MSRSLKRLALTLPLLVLLLSLPSIAQTTWSGIDDYFTCSSGVYAGCWQSSNTLGGGQSAPQISGPTATGSPSMDGSSGGFTVSSNSGYGNGLWWANTICCTPSVSAGYSKVEYDLYFYTANPTVAQALEFDVNQTISNQSAGTSVRYVFGTQCNVSNHHWQVWDEGVGWANTNVKCNLLAASWNHIVWDFQRTSSGQVNFISLTFNGHKYYINKTYGPRQLSALADDLNAAFQMDTNGAGTGFSSYLDKVMLTAQ